MKWIKEAREYVIAFITITLAMDHFGWFDQFDQLTPIAESLSSTSGGGGTMALAFIPEPTGPEPVVVISALIGGTVAAGFVLHSVWQRR